MCRHLAWLGAPRALSSVLSEPEWSLLRQAYEPRCQWHGTVNADGFGLGWYDPTVRAEPARYRRTVPIWGDAGLASFAPLVRSGAILAALRSAAIGAAIEESATAPFARGRWLFSHNGAAAPKAVQAMLPAGAPQPESTCDSAVLAAVVFARVAAGEPAPGVLADVVTRLAAADPEARLNLLFTDGAAVAATRWGASLSYLAGRGLALGGVLVASEPLDDDPGWIDVPDHTLLTAGPNGATCTGLEPSP